jgi:hypothetical protein
MRKLKHPGEDVNVDDDAPVRVSTAIKRRKGSRVLADIAQWPTSTGR